MSAEVVVPGGAAHLAADTAFAGVLTQQGHGHPAQQGQVLRRRAVLQPAVVLPEGHIQHPVQAVLDGPMHPHDSVEPVRAERRAEQVVAGLDGGLAPANLAAGGDLAEGREAGPSMVLLQPGNIVADAGVAAFAPAVAGIGLGVARYGCGGVVEKGPYVVVQRALVALERQDVGPALPDDLRGAGALAVEAL